MLSNRYKKILKSKKVDPVIIEEMEEHWNPGQVWNPSLYTEPSSQTTGRNEPCPCGSGRKFKQCCGKN